MPKIQVNEKDLSWYYRQREPGQLVVLMPGVSSFGETNYPVLVNQDNFTITLGDSVDPKDLSYQMAYSFVKSGIDVLFWRIPLDGSSASSWTFTASDSTEGSPRYYGFTAKHPGAFGNKLRVKFNKSINNIGYRVFVYDDITGLLLESFTINLTDPSSEYYYEIVNSTTNFIEFKVAGDFKFEEINFPVEINFNKQTYDTAGKVTENVMTGTGNEATATGDVIEIKKGYNGTYDPEYVVNYILSKRDDIDTEEYHPGQDIVKELRDPLAYSFNLIVDGGFNDVTPDHTMISEIDDMFVALAEARGSAVYLVDGHKNFKAEQFFAYASSPKSDDSADRVLASPRGFNTSYAAAFGPWCYSRLVSTGSSRLLPGSYVFLVRWGQSLAEGNPIWLAPAGVKRSNLNFINSTIYPVGSAVLDMWQNQEVVRSYDTSHKINPIMKLKQYGYVIYGNSTLLKNLPDGSTSMLQSFSTRILSNLIKTRAFDISLSLQFDQIDNQLFSEFKTLMTVFMDQLKYGGALYDYKIVADHAELTLDDLNTRTVPIRIMISPNPAAENFIVNLEISQAGVSFGDDSTSNETSEG